MSGRSGNATRTKGATPSPIKRGRRLPFYLLLIAVLLGAATVTKDTSTALPTAHPRSKAEWGQLYASLPMSFEANRGQSDPTVDFISRGKGYTLFLTGREAVLSLKSQSATTASPVERRHPSYSTAKTASRIPARKDASAASVLRMQLVGANTSAKTAGAEELPGKANYFIGQDRSKWRANVPTYAKVRYENVYPGVNLVYYGTRGGELEYDFVVTPGADPKRIALGIDADGKSPIRVDSSGNLIVGLQSGNLELHKPVVYQQDPAGELAGGQRKMVEAHYVLDAQNHVHFECGPYDHSRELVIDPVLLYATYIGGTGADVAYGITVDSTTFDAYIAGVTTSTNFPLTTTPGVEPYQKSNAGGNGDAFVTQMDSTGSIIKYSTYVGGTGTDIATAIAILNSNVYVTGYTTSNDFPVMAPAGAGTTTPFQQVYGGNTDAFVFELNYLGSVLVYSSYLGGSGADFGQGIAVDSAGNAYVTGTTQSPNFPLVNPIQSNNMGGQDAFVSKVDFAGENLLYSTYLGGSQSESSQAITLDSNNDAYITGYTNSTDFPVVTPYQSSLAGGADAFVTELNPAGSALVFSTYLGGTADDRAYGIALDGSKNIYITGATSSATFPTTSGVLQASLRGASNAFLSKLSPSGSSLLYSTFLGGSGTDQANGVAVTFAGQAFITGFTNSSDFPTASPVQAILGLSNNGLCGSAPCSDAFVSQIDTTKNTLVYSTFLGGNGPDFGQGIALDNTGDPYITGSTTSTNFPAIYGGSFKSSLTGSAGNAFVAKIGAVSQPNIAILPSTVNFGNETITIPSPLQQIIFVNPSDSPLAITSILVNPVGTSSTVFQETDNCIGTIPGGGSYCTMNVSFTPGTIGNITDTIIVTDNAGGVVGTQQTINLTGTGVTAATAVTVTPTSMSFSSQAVGTISPPQTATVTNTGTSTLNITKISPGAGDFAETDNCLSAPYNGVLAIGQSCTISVTFTPTASGNRAAALTISDNATGSPQSIILSGVGAAAFSLTTPAADNPTLIGNTQTDFTILAKGPDSFNGAITLTCSAGSTCAFNPNPIFVGQPSTMIISNLSPNPSSNPFPFTVTGTSGSQTFTLPLSLEFSDFTMTGSPSSNIVESGSTANYTININPIFPMPNENQNVSLIISKIDPPLADYTYSFSNATPAINISGPNQVQLFIHTVKFLNPNIPSHVLPRIPGGPLTPLLVGLFSILALVSLAIGHRRRVLTGKIGRGWVAVRLGALSSILALNLAMAACRPNILATNGTAVGNYVVTVQGTLASNTAVVRYVTLQLSVTQGQPPQ